MGMIPLGATPIVEARKKGLKPAQMVLVSLMGRLNEKNPTVYAHPGKEYDWLWARGLQVCIYTTPDANWRPVARAIASQRPSFLGLWDVSRLEGADVHLFPNIDDLEKPRDQWRWSLDFLPWLSWQNKEFAWN
jgi:hypothetical protein